MFLENKAEKNSIGRRTPSNKKSAFNIIVKILLWAMISGVAILLIAYIGTLIAQRDAVRQKAIAKAAIESCVQDQDDDFNSIEQRRFARMACNKMRHDYRQRFSESI
ncbi:hypothetical protein KVP09_05800 [Alcaligenaceae bacterium CGII-47]|nr:hypothetical protein [Alcaligenaceae bacterium CGII-47]